MFQLGARLMELDIDQDQLELAILRNIIDVSNQPGMKLGINEVLGTYADMKILLNFCDLPLKSGGNLVSTKTVVESHEAGVLSGPASP